MAFTIYDTNKIVTYNNTLDNGSGQAYFAGNVGIGTTAPGKILQVNSSTQYQGVRVSNGTNNVADVVGSSTTNDNGEVVLYSSGSQNAVLAASGSSYFNGGNVGIGTSTPAVKMDIIGGAEHVGGRVGAESTLATAVLPSQGTYIGWNENNGYGVSDFMNDPGSGGGGFEFSLFNSSGVFVSTPMVIKSSGNIGIGTTSPGAALDVASGSIRVMSSNTPTSGTGLELYYDGVYGKVLAYNRSSSVYRYLDLNDTMYVTGSSGGSVGIGTTSPSSLLEVNGGSTTGTELKIDSSSVQAGPHLTISSTGSGGHTWQIISDQAGNSSGAGPLEFYDATAGATRMVINTSGSIGIGTTSPSALLDLTSSQTGYNGGIYFRNTASGQNFAISSRDNSAPARFSISDETNHLERFVINASGSVGIGSTAPVVSLDLSQKTDAIALPNGASSTRPTGTALANGEIRYNSGTSAVEYWNGTTWISLTGGGASGGTANYVARWTGTSSLGIGALYDNGTQVSIGNTAPAAALDVTGAIYSRSNNAGSATTINWATSNEQYTTASCGAFSFSGMQDGGSYTLLVEGTTSGTCSFSNSDSPTLAFRLPSNHGATTSGTMTLYHFLRMGTYVIVTWMPGYSP
ncbi:MAG: hypothetical protein KGI37_11105 [Alphaproteobacteria bacterium]|nr:hypothetical protein [Alphaproteobacteria bacterium]